MVQRVRKMLRLQAKGKSPVIDPALFSRNRSVEEVSGIELHARLGCEHAQNPASGRLIHFCCLGQSAGRMIHYKVVVVAMAEMKLLIVRFDPFSNRMRRSKVERGTLD